ncbi:extracellular solute-binding protein [Paenibacillus qinlingensis]|uniref:extracellular solute-binding protein n=1 Tax=Paenibacillus qinlingensis TaxID=1837343 RepID=UPI0015655225|nr:extracellular solute-binding protein [Paenibacillus qinlingensis]NQX60731.1 extracellular solute-binding protein [Paenibacillus qinlingensis]
MNKKTLKVSMVLLASALAAGTITACSKGGNDKPQNTATTASDNGFTKGKFNEPVSLTTIGCLNSTFKFKSGESLDNNLHTKYFKDNLNIDIKYKYITAQDQCTNKIRLEMAANEPMPDVMYIGDPQLMADLIDSGKMMDISQAFEKYASPELKKMYAPDPSYWAQVTKDGKRYGIPLLARAQQNDPLLWIRTDYLKKLNMQAPKTLDDLEKVMDAMVNTDLGKGKNNPPLAMSLKGNGGSQWDGPVSWRGDASWIFGGFGTIPTYWNKWHGDNVEYGSIQPETKQALAKLADWFKKGYISADVGLIDVGKSDDTFRTGKAGITASPVFTAGIVRNYVQKNDAAATVEPFPIPTGPSGKAGRHFTALPTGALMVSKDYKNVDALFLYLNKLVEISNPAPGSEFEKGWKEGYDYVMKDGKVSKVEADFPDKTAVNPSKYFLVNQPIIDPQIELETQMKFYNGGKPSNPYEQILYDTIPDSEKKDPKLVNEWLGAKIVTEQKAASLANLFQGPQTETMKAKGEALSKMESETFLKIIYGKSSVDEFDTFVKNWKSMGGDKITEEVNAWYKSTSGK